MWLEHCDPEVRAAVREGQEIANRMHHSQIDVEHVFMALLQDKEGLTGEALGRLGVVPNDLIRLISRELDRQPQVRLRTDRGQVYVSPRTRRLIQTAEALAEQTGAELVGVEHLLLALLADGEGASAQVLQRVEVVPLRLRQVLDELRPPPLRPEPVPEQMVDVTATPVPAAPSTAPAEPALRDELERSARRVAELEVENQHLRELLRRADETLAYTRSLLDQEIALRHRAERQRGAGRLPAESGPSGQSGPPAEEQSQP